MRHRSTFTYHPSQRSLACLGLILSLALPSLGPVQKFIGSWAVGIYFAIVAVAVWVGIDLVLQFVIWRLTQRQALWLAGATFLVLFVGFMVVYPYANSGLYGAGSDNDDALDVSSRLLLDFTYPYYGKTYLGNTLYPFPGALLLALPFYVIFGASAYQGIFWMVIFFFFARSYLQDARLALMLLWLMLFLSPAVLHDIFTGTDRLCNSIYVLVPAIALVRSVASTGSSRMPPWFYACVMGFVLSSRPNFLFWLPLLLGAMAQLAGWRQGVNTVVTVASTYALVTGPFYFYDPQGFTPLSNVIGKLDQFYSDVSFGRQLVPLLTAFFSVVLMFCPTDKRVLSLIGYAAWVQALPVVTLLVLDSFSVGYPYLVHSAYGLHFLAYGTFASFARFVERPEQVTRS